MTAFQKRLLLFLFILAILSPIGIILPEAFKAGDAWGEWGIDTIKEMLGFIPEGMKKLSQLWKAPLPDYSLTEEGQSLTLQIISYILSGIIGAIIVMGIIFIFAKINKKKVKN
ncbi:MAG: PDGLE domain-containing protein [Thermodesulfovibrionales bacterium]